MIKLDPPTYDVGVLFTNTISKVETADFKLRLENSAGDIVAASKDFERKAKAGQVHLFESHLLVGEVTKEEMESVYTGRFAGAKGPGRPYYDELRASAPDGICLLCGNGYVTTLDHYLPKSKYPSLAVTPINLIPACLLCNTVKSSDSPTTAGEPTIHPYFDDFNDGQWLCAVVITNPVAVVFRACTVPTWTNTKNQRAKSHMKAFHLYENFAAAAATELTSIKGQLARIHRSGGAIAVEEELSFRELSSRESLNNSWRAALYKALASSNWYCDTGFNSF